MRALKFALQNFLRNPWLSTISILITLLMLFSLSFIYSINIIGQQLLSSIESKMDLGIYLKQNIDTNIINSLLSELENADSVKETHYLTPQESLEQFKQRHKNDELILRSLKELKENPLGATINLKFYNSSDYPIVLEIINKSEYQAIIQNQDFFDYQKIIQAFNNFTNKMSYGGLFVSGIFVLITMLIIFNTIKLGAITRQEEIKIMRLVGANAWFIRLPFLIESALYALIAWLLNWGILLGSAKLTQEYIQQFLEIDFNFYVYLQTKSLVPLLLLLAFSLIISTVSSSLAIKKYLKV